MANGLLNTGTPPAEMGGQEAPPAENVPNMGTSGLNPQDQEKLDIYVANGIKIIHSPEVSDQLVERMKASQNPIVDVADATISVVERLDSSGESRGVALPIEIKAKAANIFMDEIMTIGESVGMPKFNDEQKLQAVSLALGKYIDKSVKSGKMSPEELQQMGGRAAQTPQGQKILQQVGGQAGVGQTPAMMEGGV